MDLSKLAQATVKGAIWDYSTFALGKGVVFLTTVILARLLLPGDFGLMSLALVVISYLSKVQNLGIEEALIYQQEKSEQAAHVAFMLSIAMGMLFTGVTFLIAPFVADFFHEPRVIPIVQVLSLWFILISLGSVQEASLRKALDFRRRFIPQIGLRTAKGIVSILLALLGFKVWSLVWGQLSGAFIATCLYWLLSPWRPRLRFNFKIARFLVKYGLQSSVFNMLHDVFQDVDYIIIGRRMDTIQLGFYTLAFRLPDIVIAGIQSVIYAVIFPAYSKLQHDRAALRQGVLVTLQYTALICVPAAAGMYLIAPEFVEIFYTVRWMPTVPVMQALAFYAMLNSIASIADHVYRATGNLLLANQMGVTRSLLAIGVLWIAAGHNIFVVALGQVGIALFSTILQFVMVNRILPLRLLDLWMVFKPAVTGAVVMIPGALALSLLIASWPPLMRLVVLSGWGASLYFLTLWFTHRNLFRQVFEILGNQEEKK